AATSGTATSTVACHGRRTARRRRSASASSSFRRTATRRSTGTTGWYWSAATQSSRSSRWRRDDAPNDAASVQQATEVDHPLRLVEAERGMHGVAAGVLEQGVGRQFLAAARTRPGDDLLHHGTRDTLAPRVGQDVEPFDEGDRRGHGAVDVVGAQGNFREAEPGAGVVARHELAETKGILRDPCHLRR